MDIFEWEEDIPVTANNLNEMQNIINGNIVETCSTSEVKTNKVWIDNKPIYRKVFISTNSSREETISLSGLNIAEAFFDFSHSYIKFSNPERVTPIVVAQVGTSTTATAITGNQSGIYFASDFSSFTIETGINWSTPSKKVVTIEYTKTTD